VVFVLQTSLTS